MATMTITRALTKIKNLNKKISKRINENCYINYYIGSESNLKRHHCDFDANVQSVTDLINYKIKLKTLVMISNSQTTVVINGEKMTVAEAIERKNNAVHFNHLMKAIRADYDHISDIVNDQNNWMQDRLSEIIQENAGKEGKIRTKELEELIASFTKANQAGIYNEEKVLQHMNELEEKFQNFIEEVDLVLSESNARTTIEIDEVE
jgi:hypothetical protein